LPILFSFAEKSGLSGCASTADCPFIPKIQRLNFVHPLAEINIMFINQGQRTSNSLWLADFYARVICTAQKSI